MSSPNETSYYEVAVAGTGVTVRLRGGLVVRLAAEVQDVLASSGRESGGILLGSFSGKVFVVEDYDSVPSRHLSDSRFYLHSDIDRGQMASAVGLWSPKGESRLRVIGFYRSNDRPALMASDEERQLFAGELGAAASTLLLVQPGANGRTTLACYLAEKGQVSGREERLEIDLTKPAETTAERDRHGGKDAAELWPIDRVKSSPQGSLPRKNSSAGWGWIAAVSIAAGMIWVGFLQYQILQRLNAEHAAAPDQTALGLEARPVGPFWQVSWNRSSAYLAGAARGHLRIEDGTTRKEVELDAAELPTTSVVYDPSGGELWFHLELFGADGSPAVAESLRVLARLPSVAPAESAAHSPAVPEDGWNAAGIVKELGQPNSSSVTVLPLR